jgi:GMP synthase-like glutamine amidotransferase
VKRLCVIQHTEAEYLGLMEDHLEGRNIRFAYNRPFTPGGKLPKDSGDYDGLVLLGGGPYGLVGGHLLPSALQEINLAKAFLDAGLPVIGCELGAVILAVAAGGGAEEAPLRFAVGEGKATPAGQAALGLPPDFAFSAYMRDRPVPTPGMTIAATDPAGAPLAFTVGANSAGFVFHPGAKRGMMEDLIMEFDDTPPSTVEALEALGRFQVDIADALAPLMVGLCRHAGLT